MNRYLFLFLLFEIFLGHSQNQSSSIIADLDFENKQITVNQSITFTNYSKDTLNHVYLHNWMNSYKNKNTPLSKRLIEDYDKSLYFTSKKNNGYSKITLLKNKKNNTQLNYKVENYDLIKVNLDNKLSPNDSITINTSYIIKIPHKKFTRYGFSKKSINLKFWYLTPVVYTNHWEKMSNLNMDDLYDYPTNYHVEFSLANNLYLESDLNIEKIQKNSKNNTYILNGSNQSNFEISVNQINNFTSYKTLHTTVVTNVDNKKLNNKIKASISKRQITFIETFLGKYPHKKLFINKITYDKNPVYGLNQLPKYFNPFKPIFKYDIQLLKALSNKFINNSLLVNKRKNYWLNDGIQTLIMMEYIKKYYPEIKAIGTISNIWGIRSYQVAKLNFNDKYAFVYQFAMRKNLDQKLNTSADSLSTFNRKIVNKYKAGLGLIYLSDFIGDSILKKGIKSYYKKNILQITTNTSFKKILNSKTNKNLDWFFNDYTKTNKKIDYTIKKVTAIKDSLIITIKNNSDFTAPISVYGIKNKKIKFKTWVTDVTDFKHIKIPKGNFDKISLNYEAKYPEINLNNNWKKASSSIFNRPFQFRFIKDIDNPYYNQLFYNIEYSYNYYDGVILGFRLGNQTLFKKRWTFNIKPTYGTKSDQINGSFNAVYSVYPKNNSVRKFNTGIAYSSNNYAPDLTYQRFSPYISMSFKRKSLRDVGGKYASVRYLLIDKEVAKDSISLESDNYKVLNIRYGMNKPDIINNLYYDFDFQLSKKFSKLSFNAQYRKLRKNNTQIDLRFFAGSFLHNKTTSKFFDFSLNRPSDYLFDYSYFGRSEDTGLLSQQIIISEGGFKSFFKKNTANQWITTTNASFGIWRWVEFYGDIGLYKNSGFNPSFKYDSGIRLNFIQNFFEVYLPIQSSNGFEIQQKKYHEKIRFVVTLSVGKIYNFVKRGFY